MLGAKGLLFIYEAGADILDFVKLEACFGTSTVGFGDALEQLCGNNGKFTDDESQS